MKMRSPGHPVSQSPGKPAHRETGRPGDRVTILITILLLFAAVTVFGQQSDEEKELEELLSVIEQETAIATKTRMNSDYVPGIVTVLEGEELEALGFDSVWEALALVPGVQPMRDGAATSSVIVRGIQFPFNSGNIKILVDGVSLSRESAGINGSTLYLPVQQVDRIEFIRGPGSVVYGDFAFMGLVNIITKKEGARVYARRDSSEMQSGGARVGWGDATSPWQVAASVSTFGNDDLRSTTRRGQEERHWAMTSVRRGGFSVSAQVVQRDVGDTSAPGTPGGRLFAEEKSWAIQGRYGRDLAKELHATASVTLLDSAAESNLDTYRDRVTSVGLDLQWDALRRQSWLATAEFSSLDIKSASHIGPPPLNTLTTIDGEGRTIFSIALQDRIDLGEKFSVTAGARLDDYSDLGERVTPRLALVWRLSDQHIIKAQYAEGFRAPTFFELFGGGVRNRDLEFEVNATTELNYVFRRPRTVARATVFRSELKDMVFGGLPGGRFGNTREASAEGVELELSQQISEKIKLLAYASTVDTEDNRGTTLAFHPSEAAADWMSDLALLVRPFARTVVGVHWNHVGERQVVEGAAYDVLDLTASRQDIFVSGLGIRAGIKNALNRDVIYLGVRPTGVIDTRVFGGRTWWVQMSWRR